jgi:putative ABC transport system permease protein
LIRQFLIENLVLAAWALLRPSRSPSAYPFQHCRIVAETALAEADFTRVANASLIHSVSVSMFDTLLRDCRYAVRSLLKARGFTAVVVVTLALGLGANTAVFGVFNAVVLTPLPYPEPERLLRLHQTEGNSDGYFPVPGFLDIRDQARTFEVAAVYTYAELGADLTDRSRPERVRRLRIGAGYFELLRVAPTMGRTFRRDEERGDLRIAIVSDRIWRDYFGGAADVVGRSLSINGVPHQVVGVMPAWFEDPMDPATELWVTLDIQPTDVNNWQNYYLSVIGRLRDGVTPREAQAELSAISAAQGGNYRDRKPRTARLVSLREDLIGRSGTTSGSSWVRSAFCCSLRA